MALETMYEDLGLATEEGGRIAEYTGTQLSKVTSFIEDCIDVYDSWESKLNVVQLLSSLCRPSEIPE
jgi:hypothetical protein